MLHYSSLSPVEQASHWPSHSCLQSAVWRAPDGYCSSFARQNAPEESFELEETQDRTYPPEGSLEDVLARVVDVLIAFVIPKDCKGSECGEETGRDHVSD